MSKKIFFFFLKKEEEERKEEEKRIEKANPSLVFPFSEDQEIVIEAEK